MWGNSLPWSSYMPVTRGANPYESAISTDHRTQVICAHSRHKLIVGNTITDITTGAEVGASLSHIFNDKSSFAKAGCPAVLIAPRLFGHQARRRGGGVAMPS
eukprot:3583268-Pyramimonas_sp.AAC.1